MQGYFDNEIEKILQKIKNKASENQYVQGKNHSKEGSKEHENGYQNIVDQQSIDQIVQQMEQAQKNQSEMEKNPKHMYQEMMRQKLASSKFTKPKTANFTQKMAKSQNKPTSAKVAKEP